MKKLLRLGVMLLLLVTMLLSAVPLSASALDDEGTEDQVFDFVILLDCTYSLKKNDPNLLCVEACKNFINKLPIQGARVSVIAFGYPDPDNAYSYEGGQFFSDRSRLEAKRVHMVFPMSAMNPSEEGYVQAVNRYKELVERAVKDNIDKKQGVFTPIGHALAAGVDVLEKAGSYDGNACVILVSDGDREYEDLGDNSDTKLVESAVDAAAGHNWPIYSIELNYANPDPFKVEGIHEFMEGLSSKNGENFNEGRFPCTVAEDVHVAFIKIFRDIFPDPAPVPIKEASLPADYDFTVPALTSETGIDIFGSSVESVELSKKGGGYHRVITGDINEDGLIVAVEPNAYYSIKMICPEEGDWTVHINGKGGARVILSNSSLQEMGLALAADSTGDLNALTKQDTVSFDAFFSYQGHEVRSNTFYTNPNNRAILSLTDSAGVTQEFEMKGTEKGYHLDVNLSDVHSGGFTARAEVEHVMFRNGIKKSNLQRLYVMNQELKVTGNEEITVYGFVGNDLPAIELNKIFDNPDKDPILLDLSCVNDPTVRVQFEHDLEQLTIRAPELEGEYKIEVRAKDSEMQGPVIFNGLTLFVENRMPTVDKIPRCELWTDKYSFQKNPVGDASVDLLAYFHDPDGAIMSFSAVASDNATVSWSVDGANLILHPLSEGNTVLTITADDGEKQVSGEMKVKVISGKAAYWRDHWILYVIGAAAFVLALLTLIVLIKNKRVKGEWDIVFDLNGAREQIPTMNIAKFTSVGRKGSFLLTDLLRELTSYTTQSSMWDTQITSFFSGPAGAIKLAGVIRKRGCKVKGIPNDDGVKVYCNGLTPKNGSLDVYSGELEVRIEDANLGVLRILMNLQ